MHRFLPIIISCLFLSAFFQTNATTIVVQNTNDSGTGSLRSAIANSQSGDVIRFNPNLLNGGSHTITLSSYLSVPHPLTIKGLYNQTDTLFISGNNATQILVTNLFTANSSIVLDSLVFINANSTNYGGAIYYEDHHGTNSLIVRNCIFRNNTATGGAIGCQSYSTPQTIRIENSIIQNNHGNAAVWALSAGAVSISVIHCEVFGNSGGGIKSKGPVSNVVVEGSSFHDNVIGISNEGAGINSQGAISSVTVSNSTFYGNSAGYGAAIFSGAGNPSSPDPNEKSTVTLTNCTVTGNAAQVRAVVYSYCLTASEVKVTNCTITGNTDGGGLYSESAVASAGSQLIIKSSIVALNADWDAANINPYTITSGGFNILGVISGGNVSTDQMNVTAGQLNLGPLQLNGGITKTMLPGSGSVAIDMGDPADLSAAQNAPLTGSIRDVGAAEVCSTNFGDSTAIACGPISWYGNLYSVSGNYTHQLVNAGGCDSIVTLNLTILEPYETTDQVTHCGPFTWPLNGLTYAFPGIFKDTVQSINGCDSIVELNLTIFSIPNADVMDNGDGTFTATYSGFLQWIDCATNTVVATGETFTPQQNGNYALIAMDGATSCTDTSDCILVDYLSLDSKDQLALSLSPNPTNDRIHISFSGSDAELTVYDVQGKIVLKDRIQNQGIISTQNLERGVYLFDFNNSNGHGVQRVVKQ